jgi:hypothetical protein
MSDIAHRLGVNPAVARPASGAARNEKVLDRLVAQITDGKCATETGKSGAKNTSPGPRRWFCETIKSIRMEFALSVIVTLPFIEH